MNIQAWVLDRIETTFILMKNNLLNTILPLFIFNYLFFGIIYLFFINYVSWIIWNLSDFNWWSIFQLIYSAEWVLVIAILMFLFLLYAILYIPILLATIRIIHKSFINEDIILTECVQFWFSNILNSFKTYWYIFKYIYLLPAILFIIWGILFNLWYFLEIENDLLNKLSIWLMICAFILFIMFAIYRWLKANFVLYSATSQESFTQENFNLNIKITDSNLLRILWNLILVWFIIWFASWFIEWIFDIFLPEVVRIIWLEEIINSLSQNVWTVDLNAIINNSNFDIDFSNIAYLISTFFFQMISTIWSVFVLIFTYLFMRRLEIESKENMNLELVNETESKEKFIDNVDNKIEL